MISQEITVALIQLLINEEFQMTRGSAVQIMLCFGSN